jgi:hypothetical protein
VTSRALRRLALAAALGFAAGCAGGGGGGGGGSLLTRGGADVTVDAEAIADSLELEDRFFDPGDCSLVEGSVGAPGMRRLLLFDTVMINQGDQDIVLGDPTDPVPPLEPGDFEYSPCHDHYHFTGWADYTLRDLDGNVVAFGHKQAFCLLDSIDYFGLPSSDYDCAFQGISAGWADIYDKSLDGQWVDVTGVPAGEYRLSVEVNVAGVVEERDVQPNTVTVPVTLPDPNDPL